MYRIYFIMIWCLYVNSTTCNGQGKNHRSDSIIAHYKSLIVGKWMGVKDSNSIIVFTTNFVYTVYNNDTIDINHYIIIDSSCSREFAKAFSMDYGSVKEGKAYYKGSKKCCYIWWSKETPDSDRMKDKVTVKCTRILFLNKKYLEMLVWPSMRNDPWIRVK